MKMIFILWHLMFSCVALICNSITSYAIMDSEFEAGIDSQSGSDISTKDLVSEIQKNERGPAEEDPLSETDSAGRNNEEKLKTISDIVSVDFSDKDAIPSNPVNQGYTLTKIANAKTVSGSSENSHISTASNESHQVEKSKNLDNLEEKTSNISYEIPKKCSGCTKLEEEKKIKIEIVKQLLLNKLGLENVPQVNGPLSPLPFDFYPDKEFPLNDERDDNDDEEQTKEAKIRQVFVFGTDITKNCAQKKSTGCYSFNLTENLVNPDHVDSIELWVYKQADLNDHHTQEFMVSELGPSKKNNVEVLQLKNIVKRFETRLKKGWMKIYVKRAVMRWLSKPHSNNGLAVICKTCKRQNHRTIYGDKEGLMPILVFYIKQDFSVKKRKRRATRCLEGGTNCCHKESLEISFSDIGWDYIMAPARIRPNFCTGSCNGILAAHYNHTRLVQTIQQTVTYNFGSIQTCCSPVSFRNSQSIIYRDHHGVVRKIDVPDLIVGECGCT